MGRKPGSTFSINLVGRKIGELTVIQKLSGKRNKIYDRWECLCSCGNKTVTDSYNLLSGNSGSCGGWHFNGIGKKFGKLTIIQRAPNRGKARVWLCRCDCGKNKEIRSSYLISKGTTDCGCVLKRRRQDNAVSAQNILFNRYKHRIKRKNKAFSISFDEFLKITSSPCYYCGKQPKSIIRNSGKSYVYNGIDRVNNLKGYISDNCVPCCPSCNFSKNDHLYDEFISWAFRVGENVENIKRKLNLF